VDVTLTPCAYASHVTTSTPVPSRKPEASSTWRVRARRWLRRRLWARDTLLAIGLALLFEALLNNIWWLGPDAPDLPLLPSLLLLYPALALRRAAPGLSFTLVVAALTVKLLVTPVFRLSDGLFTVALYSACAYGRRPWPAASLGIGLVAAVVGWLRGLWGMLVGLPLRELAQSPAFAALVFLISAVLTAWSVGLFRRIRLAHITTLEERARRAEADREERARHAVAEERARIAREMHDVVAHSLAVMISQAHGAQYAAQRQPERATEALDKIAQTGRESLADMRNLLAVLRSGDAPNETPDPQRTPQPGLGDLPDLVQRVRRAGLPVRHHSSGTPRRLGHTRELAVYRLVQESLTNTLKHAGPNVTAELRLQWSEQQLTVTVADDGRGPAPADAAPGGHGLIVMRERLAAVGGSMTAGARAGGGFEVRAALPYDTEHGRIDT
jgi:signal transduction histidine kinase